jgi:[ribulose-bisphosphate carboxylase]-lysine N-methyltransferase
LVAAKDIAAGDAALSVPQSLWMTPSTAVDSAVGPFVENQPAWVKLAVQLLHEKSKGDESRWSEYVATLPTKLDAPLFWSADELAYLQGSQLFSNAAGYDAYVRGTFVSLEAEIFSANRPLFPESVFSETEFLWAFGVLRARCLPPRDQGDDIALVPGLDMANHSGLVNSTWTLNGGGLGSVFGGAGSGPSMLFRLDERVVAGAECFVNYGPNKVDSQFALDFGFADAFCLRPGYVLGPIEIPDADVNQFDKQDVLEVAGLLRAPLFTIRAFEDPPAELRVFSRLLNLKDSDAFLLEAIFRAEAWSLISEPVSETNEREACLTMIAGCEAALSLYPSRVDEDRAVAEDASSSPRLRLAARVAMGEKQALLECMGFFANVERRLDQMEYYQERRLRSLNLLDRDGNSTYDPFQDTMA